MGVAPTIVDPVTVYPTGAGFVNKQSTEELNNLKISRKLSDAFLYVEYRQQCIYVYLGLSC